MTSLLIAYGSETGTAHDVAHSLWRECRQREIPVRVAGLDEYDVQKLVEEKCVIMVIATSGQGELPTNMRDSWKMLLRKSLPKDWLSNTTFAVVALGDSSYAKYNYAGKKMFRRLLQLGATSLSPIALCDDQHELGIDGALTSWRESLFEEIGKRGWFPDAVPLDMSKSVPAKYRLNWTENGHVPPDSGEFVKVTVVENSRVTAEEHFQDTRLLRFDVGTHAEYLSYKSGDVLMIHPHNPIETVEIAIEALKYPAEILDRPFTIESMDPNIKLPPTWITGTITTIRTCLHRLFDLQHIPRKSFFEVLGSISSDPDEKERLLELATPERLDELLDYSTRARRTAAEALRDFYRTAATISSERLFDIFPMIRARAFSIASCPLTHTGFVELLVAKVEYKARMSDKRRGLCSTYISRLKNGDEVFVKVRPGTFRFPHTESSVICIGPGTGVAPFRSLLNYRHRSNGTPAPSMLFFGCRGKTKDFYFEREWTELDQNKCHVAFSRDQEEKVYVQDLIAENSADLWALISSGAAIFIAGSSGDMPKAVCEAINKIGEANGRNNLVESLEKAGRLQYETWA